MGRTLVSQAASSMTGPTGTHAFDACELLNALGLEGAQRGGASAVPLSLGEGAWDPATGGAIAVRTNLSMDVEGRLQRLETKYLALNPAGDFTENKLVEFAVSAQGQRLKIRKMSFLGRMIDVKAPEAVTRILGFLQQIHSDIRNLEMPDIGKAFHDFQIAGLVGERMHLPGLSRSGGFDFRPLTGAQAAQTKSDFHLPYGFLPELLGLGSNDLDPQQAFGAARERTGVDRQSGGAFRCKVTRNDAPESSQLVGAIVPLNPRADKAIPDLLRLNWHQEAQHAVVDRLALLGEESRDLPVAQRHKRLGIVNAMNRDLRRRKYPSLPDHIAAFDQQDLLDRQSVAGELDEHPKMIVKVYSGHNAREYLPGFGGTIGGNSKGILSYSRGEAGQVISRGFRIDAGIGFSKQGGIQAGEHGSWDRVLPDPGSDLGNLKHDLITHLHADHMQAIVDEARCGLQVGRTVHAGAYDIRVLEQFLKKEKVALDLWPTLHPLDGEGWIHLDDGNNRLLSAYYSTNAIPHSTPVTAFVIAPPPYKCDRDGRATGGKTEPNPHYWSYVSLGDMSFGKYNLKDYQGEKPPDTGFKRDFFSRFKSGLRQQYPDLPREMRRRVDRINVAECDPTSIHREGFSPDVVDYVNNMTRVAGLWFKELGIIEHSLSTAKREREGGFHVATRTGRHLSGEGAYLENRLTDMNVMGVNTDVIPRNPDGGNINAYLEWYAASAGLSPVRFHRRSAEEWKELVKEHPEQTYFLASGSQGTEIEQDSVGTQSAEGWSRFQLDPKYCRAAYGVDIRQFLIIYAQSAIPGNEDKQLDQVRKTAYENDLMVGVSVHDGARFYNLKEPFLSRIKADCDQTGQRYTVEPMGGLLLHGFALYPPGHGWKEDWRQGFLPWFKENGVEAISVQHYPRLESVHVMHGLADEIGLRHPMEPLPNHVAWTIDDQGAFKNLGAFTPSFILARDNRRFGKYYGGTTEYLHAVFPSSEGGLSDSGLFVPENSVYFNKFGQGDYEKTSYESALPVIRSRRDPDAGMIERPPGLGASRVNPTRSIASPRRLRSHPHLLGA